MSLDRAVERYLLALAKEKGWDGSRREAGRLVCSRRRAEADLLRLIQQSCHSLWKLSYHREIGQRGYDSRDAASKAMEEFLLEIDRNGGLREDAGHAARWLKVVCKHRVIDLFGRGRQREELRDCDYWAELGDPDHGMEAGAALTWKEILEALQEDHQTLRLKYAKSSRKLRALEWDCRAFLKLRLERESAAEIVGQAMEPSPYVAQGEGPSSMRKAEARVCRGACRYARELRSLVAAGESALLRRIPALGLRERGARQPEEFSRSDHRAIQVQLRGLEKILVEETRVAEIRHRLWALEQRCILGLKPREIVRKAPEGSPYHVPPGGGSGVAKRKSALVGRHVRRLLERLQVLLREWPEGFPGELRVLLGKLVAAGCRGSSGDLGVPG